MLGEAVLLTVMRRILWLVATGLGSIGVASVWGSFHNPDLAIEAFMTLPVASFIIIAMPQPPASARRGPPSGGIPAKARQLAAAWRPRSRSS